jgi:sugar lactone lactonase YvrE
MITITHQALESNYGRFSPTRYLRLLCCLGLFFSVLNFSVAETLTVTTLSGQFNNPIGVAVDSGGSVFVADNGTKTVRVILPSGAVTTLAGASGLVGSADGTGSGARFSGPFGLATDNAGNVYVADGTVVRKITRAAVVTTLAGSPNVIGNSDGIGSGALFTQAYGVAVDSNGNVFVADKGNNTIRKITPSLVVTTVAGRAPFAGNTDGLVNTALFNSPTGVAVDNAGNLYVADSGNSTSSPAGRIRRISSTGSVTTIAGAVGGFGSADGVGSAALFNNPVGLAVDGAGSIYVSDSGNNTIRKVTLSLTGSGIVATIAGQAGNRGVLDGSGSASLFRNPTGIAVDGAGHVFVADSGNNLIRTGTITAAVAPSATHRLVNLSSRGVVGKGGDILIGGFVVSGTTPETVLIRAVGPTLGSFGVAGTLSAPVLTIFDSTQPASLVIASNTGWSNPPVLGNSQVSVGALTPTNEVMDKVGAFRLPTGSADSALLLTLPPGLYSAQVSGANGSVGVALIELYEVP